MANKQIIEPNVVIIGNKNLKNYYASIVKASKVNGSIELHSSGIENSSKMLKLAIWAKEFGNFMIEDIIVEKNGKEENNGKEISKYKMLMKKVAKTGCYALILTLFVRVIFPQVAPIGDGFAVTMILDKLI